jgi:hypothetical protein
VTGPTQGHLITRPCRTNTTTTAIAASASAPAFPRLWRWTTNRHSLYLAWDDFLTLPGAKSLTLTFGSPNAVETANLPSWSTWDGQGEALTTSGRPVGTKWQVVLGSCPRWLHDQRCEAAWLQAAGYTWPGKWRHLPEAQEGSHWAPEPEAGQHHRR